MNKKVQDERELHTVLIITVKKKSIRNYKVLDVVQKELESQDKYLLPIKIISIGTKVEPNNNQTQLSNYESATNNANFH